MRHFRIALVATLALALAVSCSSGYDPTNYKPVVDPPFLPERGFDLRGTITKVEQGSGGALVRILVEEKPSDESGSMKDMVTITPETRIYREEGDRLRNASTDELRAGAIVAAWYDGAVRESYPRQANAVAVVIAR